MQRYYTSWAFDEFLENVREKVTGVAISTDIIVGFPGETESMFAESLDFIKKLDFARVHVFPYSPRIGTPAASMPEQVSEQDKKDRVHRLQKLAEEMAENFHKKYLGTVQNVLFETKEKGITDGLTDTYIRVYTDDDVLPGEIYKVKLEKLYNDGVYGKINECN